MATGGSTKTVLTALFANGGIAIAKFVGFLITRSSSMLTESVHSLADTSNQALLLLGGRQAKKAASKEHPFGYGRERYFWSFVVAMILFSLGGLFAIYEGWEKIHHPHELESPAVALVILVLALLLEGFAFNTARTEADHVRGKLSWVNFIRRSRNPELPVVLLEDSGAMLGLIIAFFGVLASMFIDPVFDGYATLAIGVLLLCIAVVLAIEMKSLIIGESAVPEDRDRLIAAIEGHRDVHSLIHMRTQHIGPDELLVGAKVQFRATLDGMGLVKAINEAETEMRKAVPIARVIYLEPDLSDSPSITMGTLPVPPLDYGAESHNSDDHNSDGLGLDGEADGDDGLFAGTAATSATAAAATMPPPPTPASIGVDAHADPADVIDTDSIDTDAIDTDLDVGVDAADDVLDKAGPDTATSDAANSDAANSDAAVSDKASVDKAHSEEDASGSASADEVKDAEGDADGAGTDGDESNDSDTNDSDTNDGDTNDGGSNDGDSKDGDTEDPDATESAAWGKALGGDVDDDDEWAANAGLDDDTSSTSDDDVDAESTENPSDKTQAKKGKKKSK